MAKIAGTCFFKVDGQQLSLTGGIEVPMNTNVRDDRRHGRGCGLQGDLAVTLR